MSNNLQYVHNLKENIAILNNTFVKTIIFISPKINSSFKQYFFANNQSISEEYSSVKYDQDNALEWEK